MIEKMMKSLCIFVEIIQQPQLIMSQQPFQKVSKAPKNLFIRIQPPNSPGNLQEKPSFNSQKHRVDNINVLKSEIREVKGRIVQSKLALVLSRKQEASPEKLIASDYIGIAFDHESSKKRAETIKIGLSKVYERQDEAERDQQPEEGNIQIPLHLDSSFEERDRVVSKNDLQHFQTSRYQTQFAEVQKKKSLRQGKFSLTDRKVQIQPRKRELFKIEDFKPRDSVEKAQREKSKRLLTQRQNINRSLQDKTNQMSALERYFNQSMERLPKYFNTDHSLSKQKKNLNLMPKKAQKIKIKLNKPSGSKLASDKYTLRPRYQIQMPSIKIDQFQTQNKPKENIETESDWEQLKKQVSKYQFVRKYLSESDIFAIYQYLKKNKIKQQKWPLFVVDQASKHMKVHGLK